MSAELEPTIMREIGLGNNAGICEGSPSCVAWRINASENLPIAILQHADAGEPIVPPDDTLIRLVKHIARLGEAEPNTLHNSWQAISLVIRAHIDSFAMSADQRSEHFREVRCHIEETCLKVPAPDLASSNDTSSIGSSLLTRIIAGFSRIKAA